MTAPSNTARRTFGVELERNLRARGWSISEAARRSGISAENLRAMFLGRHVPAPNDWSNMCHKLGVSSVVQHWRAAEAEALEEGEQVAPRRKADSNTAVTAFMPEARDGTLVGKPRALPGKTSPPKWSESKRTRARQYYEACPPPDVEAEMVAFAYQLVKEHTGMPVSEIYGAVFDRYGFQLAAAAVAAIQTRVGAQVRPGKAIVREQAARARDAAHALAMKIIADVDAGTAPEDIAASTPTPSAKRRIEPRTATPAPSVAPLEQAIASLVAATPGLQGLSITIGEDGTARVDYSIKASLTVGPARNTPTPSGADLT